MGIVTYRGVTTTHSGELSARVKRKGNSQFGKAIILKGKEEKDDRREISETSISSQEDK